MQMIDVDVVLRAPRGSELSDERCDAIYDAGFDDATLLSRQPGQLIMSFTFRACSEWEEDLEDRVSALLEEMEDLELIEITEG